jgi:hypothetical protein
LTGALGFLVGVCLKDDESKDIRLYKDDPNINAQCIAFMGNEGSSVLRAQIPRKQAIRLTIMTDEYSVGGNYRLELSGAVDFGKAAATLTCLPKQGTLHVKMKDGSVRTIELSRAEEISVQP